MSDAIIEIRSRKAAVRRALLKQRGAIPAALRQQAGAAAARHFARFLKAHGRPGIVSGYLAIGDEIDPQPSLDTALALGWRLALPVMVGRNQPLIFRAWMPGDALASRQWGIREPVETAETVELDVLLLPLLAFDTTGGRLGYGGGYYDRTLAGLRARRSVVAIGIAFDEQRIDTVPLLDYDQRLDCVLTPSGLICCPDRAPS